jgi:hypothetical protein
LKCEFTMSIPARENEFPYVCHNDVEWVVVSPSDIRDPLASRGWNLPLEKRDGWYFWCERCIRLTFPNCTFHHDTFFMLPLEGF